ncbi:cupin domain-containing protein [Pseudomonas cavernicola]|uniref:Cupin domain-containing protein n=1 Tax=Pseudomonas cavernicola TaxID=2320866 RepID=A0A418XME8_9PSED|nr:cupin domain-containing protein [Pseudomonas cavernicola]RJG13633.1 cupin domain-containing protein [Pseudomonas cavernicola]
MTTTRIVTGHDEFGHSQVISCGPLPGSEEFTHSRGFSAALVWQTPAVPALVDQPIDPALQMSSVVPAPGGTSALLVTFPPDALAGGADFDPVAATEELCERLPGLGERFEAEHPGFHRTDTIDYGVVLEGEITLELDDGRTSRLKQGDLVVQMGTRHAWRNTGNIPARLLFVLVGAKRPEPLA